jgi:hypothetical protein
MAEGRERHYQENQKVVHLEMMYLTNTFFSSQKDQKSAHGREEYNQ